MKMSTYVIKSGGSGSTPSIQKKSAATSSSLVCTIVDHSYVL